MSESDDCPPGRWNPGSLHQHFTTRLSDIAEKVAARHDDLEGQLDRRIKTQERERSDTERHLQAMIEAGDDRLEAYIQAQRESIRKSEDHYDKRLYDLNKVRDSAMQDRGLFATKESVDAKLEAMAARIGSVEDDQISRRGSEQASDRRKTTATASTGAIVGIVTAAVAILGLLIALANALTAP